MPQFRYFGSSNKTLTRTIVFVLAVVCMLFLLRVPALSRMTIRVQGSVVRVATGFGNMLTRVTKPENSLMSQYQACQADRLTLAVDQSEHQALLRQLDELEQLLDYRTKSGATGVVTHVLSRSIDNDATLIIIDKGEADDVIGFRVCEGRKVLLNAFVRRLHISGMLMQCTATGLPGGNFHPDPKAAHDGHGRCHGFPIQQFSRTTKEEGGTCSFGP